MALSFPMRETENLGLYIEIEFRSSNRSLTRKL